MEKGKRVRRTYARLLYADLSAEEKALMDAVPEDTAEIMRQDLKLLCVREMRMLSRIAALEEQAGGVTAQDRIGRIEEGMTHLRREKQRIIDTLRADRQRERGRAGEAEDGGRLPALTELLAHPMPDRDLSEVEEEDGVDE